MIPPAHQRFSQPLQLPPLRLAMVAQQVLADMNVGRREGNVVQTVPVDRVTVIERGLAGTGRPIRMAHSRDTTSTDDIEIPAPWLSAIEARYLADLRGPELTRALRAVSSAYVERRHKVRNNLDSAGKRAAFGLFYAPLHFLAVRHAVRALGAALPPPRSIIDLGCGTGAAGAAWALGGSDPLYGGQTPIYQNGGPPSVLGIDRHPWAIEEARWTYRQLGIAGRPRQGDASRLPPTQPGTGVIAAYLLNELESEDRLRLEEHLLDAAARGVRVLVVEPISRSVTPWWNQTAARFTAAGGRADEWRFPVTLPPLLARFDRAAGLDHRELTLKTLFMPGGPIPA